MARTYSIGHLANRAACAVQTVRHYERIGLMPTPERTPGRQRIYRTEHLQRLAFIRHARELGFPLDAVRELLSLTDEPERSCETVDRVARDHLARVRERISALQGIEAELERMVSQCAGGHVANCRIVEVLSDHSHAHCLSDGHADETAGL